VGCFEVFSADFRKDAVAAVADRSIRIREFEGVDSEEMLPGEAGWKGLWQINEGHCGGVFAEEYFHRRWVRNGRAACRDSAQELKKFLSCARWETVGGVADDIGVHVIGEMKADSATAWTG